MPATEAREILDLHDRVASFMATVNKAYIQNNPELLEGEVATGEEITKQAKALARKLVHRPLEDQLEPFTSTSYSRQVAAYRRVRDHLINILEVVKGEK